MTRRDTGLPELLIRLQRCADATAALRRDIAVLRKRRGGTNSAGELADVDGLVESAALDLDLAAEILEFDVMSFEDGQDSDLPHVAQG